MKNKRLILILALAALPVAFIISVLIYAQITSLSIFPSEKYSAIGWWPHASEKSLVESFKAASKKIEFEYTLNGSPAFAGFSVFLDEDYPFLDLSGYSEVTVRLSASRANHFGVIVQTFEKGITQLSNGNYAPLRYWQTRTEIGKRPDTYSLPLAKFGDPEWWITLYGTRGKALDENPLKESVILQFFFDDVDMLGQRDKIVVEEISFHVWPASFWLWPVIASGCYYIVFAALLILPRMRRRVDDNRAKLLSSYRRIEEASSRKKELESVRKYITEKYDNPDISLETISGEIGLSQKRITEIVRKEYAMTFKECINWLRIQEAKRLLSETDMNITDIAFRLGFNSNSYFGSIFRDREGVTPREYREKRGAAK